MTETVTSQDKERKPRKSQIGKVLSAKMDKTITVVIERMVRHPMYAKYIRRRTKLYAHDEDNVANMGDVVEVMAVRPLSKQKRWRLLRVVRKAQG